MLRLNIKYSLYIIILFIVSFNNSLAENWLYRTPTAPAPSAEDQVKTCAQLEQEISDLSTLTYSYKPGFYDDPYQGPAVLAGFTVAAPALLVPVYSGYIETQERQRIHTAEERIETLRHLKANKRCFVERVNGSH